MVEIAVAGVGGWGKNIARNYYQIPGASLRYICDLDEQRREHFVSQYPGPRTTDRFEDLLEDLQLQAIAIATNGPTHYRLCKAALEAGKDVYVEKPFVLDVGEARELIRIAEEHKRILMVGHLLEYHPVITRLRSMIDDGELGRIHYIYSQRLNLGTVREDENALWNFAPHDISSILYLLGEEPTSVSANGQCYLRKDIEDVVFMTLQFADQSMAHVHVSWLDPHKVRKMTIVGSKQMAVFDDLETNEKLKVYDKGAQYDDVQYDTFAEYVGLRFGDIHVPYIKVGEPLRLECQHFLDCVENRTQPRSDGADGLRVVSVLDAAQRSLKSGGQPVSLNG